jgi:hypothetical protein
MKKFFVYMLLALMLIATAGFVSAQEISQGIDFEVSGEIIDKELKMMSCENGADYRFNQLIISLEAHIAHAKDVVETADISSQAKEDLSNIVSQLEQLSSQANEYVVDLEKSPDVLASEFIAFRQEANLLTKEFRTVLNEHVKDEKLSQLQQNINDRQAQRLQDARLQIKEKHSIMLAYKLEDVMAKAGIKNNNVSQLHNGMINAQERQQLMNSMMNSFSNEEKVQLRNQIHKDSLEMQNNSLQYKNRVRENINTFLNNRNRLENSSFRMGRFL